MLSQPSNSAGGDKKWATLMTAVAQRGDKAAFSELYDHFAPRIKSYLLGQGAQQGVVDELVQAAMLQLWEKAGLYDPSVANVTTWVFRVARNRFFDHLRKEKLRDRPAPEPWQSEETPQQADLPDMRQVQQAIKQLPSRQAQVIYMSFYQSMSHREIAESLEIPLGSVKSSLRLAFEKLRSCIGGPL